MKAVADRGSFFIYAIFLEMVLTIKKDATAHTAPTSAPAKTSLGK
jgi:hypothetical protein